MPFSKQQHRKPSRNRNRNRNRSTCHPPPRFWNDLTKLWLTKSALKEAHRQFQLLCPSQTSVFNSYTFASDFLRRCSATSLQRSEDLPAVENQI
ncbi:uncharacterized protein BO66DRAFT_395195 [Aspergillus aculeatinus CBS 121060]|uniref:Uncharacterized protein n=1 Tax=Aspergillus aculeatinus CBS 121060 TaxID=1448322 RepID=A0ACD1GWV8_9EURO|nr:hypothetical protein BO66DRAFT_395195 [Aspergillus aculeatinus CBS 121060]RAH65797.1 hypothetical protein BO66DRAFT_395195 [Aspergillus aculeatinus CBS 121060]